MHIEVVFVKTLLCFYLNLFVAKGTLLNYIQRQLNRGQGLYFQGFFYGEVWGAFVPLPLRTNSQFLLVNKHFKQ